MELDVLALRWRTGSHFAIHLYAIHPSGDRDQDIPIGTAMTDLIAMRIVEDHNQIYEGV